jgi:hypothetical protein
MEILGVDIGGSGTEDATDLAAETGYEAEISEERAPWPNIYDVERLGWWPDWRAVSH